MTGMTGDVFMLPAGVVRSRPALAEYAQRLRRLLEQSTADGAARPWLAGESFTCDGGALAAALIARGLGMPVRLCVGLYRHTDPELRAASMGDTPNGLDPAEWQRHLDWVAANAMDEHHHWVLLWPETGVPVLLDPNGPVRGEPYAQLVDRNGPGRYRELGPGPDRDLVYSPEDDWDDIAREVYPGLLDAVAATLA